MTERKSGPLSVVRAPAGTRVAGRRLWDSVLADYELEEHEAALLVEAVRTVDLLADLNASVRAEGAIVESPQGRKANPAAVEARQQRIALARLLAALRLPAGDEGDQAAGRRPQRRVGVRGVQSFYVPALERAAIRARRAADGPA